MMKDISGCMRTNDCGLDRDILCKYQAFETGVSF